MKSIPKLQRIPLEFRVNGLEFRSGYLEHRTENPTKVEVLIEHRLLGRFRLHNEFDLELKTSSSDEWRRVSLEELKAALLLAAKNHIIEQVEDEENEKNISSCVEPLRSQNSIVFPRIAVEGDDSHLELVREVFSAAGESFRIVGGLDSCGRCMGHLTLAVQSPRQTQKLLMQAGFLPNRESGNEFIDSRNGWKIRLLQDGRWPTDSH